MPVDLMALTVANTRRWNAANLTRGPEFKKPAEKAVANKARYQEIARRSGMPIIGWVFIAVSHYRESTADFSKSLAQGDPWNRVSTHIPRDRGPFKSFEDAAVDALVNCAPHAARLKDWTIGGMLTNLERYNGIGYASRGVPSAYIWSGTDQYRGGKFIADGVYDPSAIDKQLGCAGLILAMMTLDPTIQFEGAQIVKPPAGPIPEPTLVRDGAWLQTSLNKLGAKPQLATDGIVGPATRNAVRAFQDAQGLVVDGLVGPATFAALDAALAAGKPVPTLPIPPDIVLPPPGSQAHHDLAPTFWGRVLDLFKPKEH